MSKLSWSETKGALARLGTPPPRAREPFWEAFRGRASQLPRETPNYGRRQVAVLNLRLVGAFAALAMVAAMGAVVILGQNRASLARQNTEIRTLEVTAQNTGVTILRDRDSSSTILWINDLSTE